MLEHRIRLEEAMPLFQEQLARGQSVQFAPRGTSMLPMLREGKDSVILSPLPQRLKKYDIPLYRRGDGQYVLHRIVDVGETYTCVGDNQFALERGIDHGQLIAVVTAFTRAGRRWSVDHPAYRVYCRFWHFSRPVRRVWRWAKGRIRRILK
ncbi:MAG: S24/S26 family peptidase [Oscillospiraceae bacterium]|nr:S24/S26 family peptidase [Oscillospiraceae bacterium]